MVTRGNIPEEVNVLFVDDEEEILKALKRQLSLMDDIVGFYETNPLNVESILENNKIDIIVADIVMPEKDGITLLKEIKSTHPDIIRIMLTAHGDFETSLRAINEAEVFGFITKPWEKNYLFGHIEMAKNVVNHRIKEDIRELLPFFVVGVWNEEEELEYFYHTAIEEETAKYLSKRVFMTAAGLFGYRYRFSDNTFTLPFKDVELVTRCHLMKIEQGKFAGNVGLFAFDYQMDENEIDLIDKKVSDLRASIRNDNFEPEMLENFY